VLIEIRIAPRRTVSKVGADILARAGSKGGHGCATQPKFKRLSVSLLCRLQLLQIG
jgi:hypothetical protein